MVTALPPPPLPLPKQTHTAEMDASPRPALKRALQTPDASYVTNPTYSPSKRRSPTAEFSPPLSSPMPSAQQPKPVKSALANRSTQSAALAALKSATDGYSQRMYLAYINNALAEKAKGNQAPYVELVAQFHISPSGSGPAIQAHSTPTQLRSWLSALSHVVSALDRSHAPLVENILTLPWTTMNESFAHMWIKFVCSLVSARGEWLSHVLHRAVKGLSYRSDWRALACLGLSNSHNTAPTRRQIYDRIHLLLRSLLALIPTLPSTLAPLLVRQFPHKRESRAVQLVYVKNILAVSEYCAELSEAILSAVIDRAIQIDVEIQVELDDLDEDEEQALDIDFKDPFETAADQSDLDDSDDDSEFGDIDNLSDLSDDEGSDQASDADSNAPDPEAHKKGFSRIQGLVGRLDSIMHATLEHLQRLEQQYSATINGRTWLSSPATAPFTALSANLPPISALEAEANRRNSFHTLLAIFSRAMLPTFKSRHVQFLLFWFNSLDPEFSDLFLGLLLSKSLYGADKDEPPIIRSAAASYVASFVSRASYIDGPTSRIVVLNLCAFMDAHLEASNNPETEMGAAPPGAGAHAVFYAVSQALFYIFCFRWRDLKLTEQELAGLDGDADADADADAEDLVGGLHNSVGGLSQQAASSWCDGLSAVQRAITSHLNPLKFCSPTVVKQFARIAQHTGFLYCYSIIEANNRASRVRSAAPSRSTSINTIDLAAPRGGSNNSSDNDSDSGTGTPRPSEAGGSPTAAVPDPVPIGSDLEAFFPFDPYKLRTSASFIEPLYRDWADVAPDGDNDSDDDDDEDEDEDDDDDDEGQDKAEDGSAAPGMDIPGALSPNAANQDDVVSHLEAMSISPYRV